MHQWSFEVPPPMFKIGTVASLFSLQVQLKQDLCGLGTAFGGTLDGSLGAGSVG